MEKSLEEMAVHFAGICTNPSRLLVMGMASRGVPMARRLADLLEKYYHCPLPTGSLDATFYRDDFHFRKNLANPEMRITAMPRPVEGMDIILLDDVLYTGRTIRAAMEAIMDMGRPNSIRLGVLVDRGHRQLPICPDYAGLIVTTCANQEVRVYLPPLDSETAVWLVEVGENS